MQIFASFIALNKLAARQAEYEQKYGDTHTYSKIIKKYNVI